MFIAKKAKAMELNWRYLGIGVLIFLASFILSLIMVAIVVVNLPSTYFLDRSVRQLPIDRHPLLRLALRVAKNLVGVVLVVAGILLSLPGIPGQGILTCLIGILLLDFPGKQRLERRIIRHPRVRAAVDRLRKRFRRPPLQLPDEEKHEESAESPLKSQLR